MSPLIQAPEAEECHCACHQALVVVVHPMPCCERCAGCGRRIRMTAIVRHRERCPRSQPPLKT